MKDNVKEFVEKYLEWYYKLKPIKEVEPDWYKLKWKPIKYGTYNIWFYSAFKSYLPTYLIGLRFWTSGYNRGWGKQWKGISVEFGLLFFEIHFWIRWNIIMHKDGPFDCEEKRPLDLSGVKKCFVNINKPTIKERVLHWLSIKLNRKYDDSSRWTTFLSFFGIREYYSVIVDEHTTRMANEIAEEVDKEILNEMLKELKNEN